MSLRWLYILYVARHGLNVYRYANEIQIYISTSVDDAAMAVDRLTACLVNVEAWLRASRLRLNPTETQVMWLCSSYQLARLDVPRLKSCRHQFQFRKWPVISVSSTIGNHFSVGHVAAIRLGSITSLDRSDHPYDRCQRMLLARY